MCGPGPLAEEAYCSRRISQMTTPPAYRVTALCGGRLGVAERRPRTTRSGRGPRNSAVQVSENGENDYMASVSGDRVVWSVAGGSGSTTTDAEIWTWNALEPTAVQVTYNAVEDGMYDVSGERIAWLEYDGPSTNVYTATPMQNGGAVNVRAGISPALTFSVEPGNAPSGGTVTASAVDFGTITPGTAKVATQGYQSRRMPRPGYSVTAEENRPLTAGAYLISDVVGDAGSISELTAGPWSNATTYGFGYTLANASGTSAAFTSGYKQFANQAASEVAQPIMSANVPSTGDAVDVGYKLNVSGDQVAGAYTNTITYVATANF